MMVYDFKFMKLYLEGNFRKINSIANGEISHPIKKPQNKLKQFNRHQKVQLSFSGSLVLFSWDFHGCVFFLGFKTLLTCRKILQHRVTISLWNITCVVHRQRKTTENQKWICVPYTTSLVSLVMNYCAKQWDMNVSEVPLEKLH